MTDKAIAGPFRDIHPSQTGRRPKGTLQGIDLPPGDVRSAKPNESRWVRCYQCGFPVDTERANLSSQRDGITVERTTQTASGQDDVTVSNPVVSFGCPFCGASESCLGPEGR